MKNMTCGACHQMLCLVVLGVLMISSGEVMAGEKAAVRVMSFNIRYGTAQDGENHWEKRKEFVVSTIRAFAPDVLGTQETMGFQREYLSSSLPEYESVGVGRDDGEKRGEMMVVYFRRDRFEKLDEGHLWLSETPDVAGSKSWDSALPRMATWVKLRDQQADGRELYFFNTHFDHKGEVARQESASLLRRSMIEIAGRVPLVVTGDFNSAEASIPYQNFFQSDSDLHLVDTYRKVVPEPVPNEQTAGDFNAVKSGKRRIDWIGCTADFVVLKAEIDRTSREGRTPSDHFPVNAVLEWK